MLDWLFRPSCPCDPAAKTWVEERLEWLAGEFDDSAFSGRRVVLPTPEFFPDPYDGSKKAVRTLLERVCEYMDVVPDLVALKFVADAGKIWLVNDVGHYLPGAAGTYEEGERKFIIRIDKSGLDDPMGLVGTIAHELAHVRLLGEPDHAGGVRQRGADRLDGRPLRAGHLPGQHAPELGEPVQQVAGHGPAQARKHDPANVRVGAGAPGLVPRGGAARVGAAPERVRAGQPQAGPPLPVGDGGLVVQTGAAAAGQQERRTALMAHRLERQRSSGDGLRSRPT